MGFWTVLKQIPQRTEFPMFTRNSRSTTFHKSEMESNSDSEFWIASEELVPALRVSVVLEGFSVVEMNDDFLVKLLLLILLFSTSPMVAVSFAVTADRGGILEELSSFSDFSVEVVITCGRRVFMGDITLVNNANIVIQLAEEKRVGRVVISLQ